MKNLLLIFLALATLSAQAQEQSTNPKTFQIPDLTLTVGGGANYFVPGVSREWTDYEQGIGLQMGYNATATLMVKVRDKIGFSLTSGKSFSGIHKQYLTEGVEQYRADYDLSYIPIILGARFYLGKSFYVEPGIGANLTTLTIKTSADHPLGEYELSDKKTKFLGITSLGVDSRFGNLALDFSGFAAITENYEAFGLIDPIFYTGIKIGIGYAHTRK